jgi:Tfp pilus assembly protein PilF
VEGVKVTVTSPDLATFFVTKETNKRGGFVVAYADAYIPYLYKFEKDGYQTREIEFKAASSGLVRNNFEIFAGGDSASSPTQSTSSSNEAVSAFNAAVTAFQANDLGTAEAKLKEAIEIDPKVFQAHLLLAEVQNKQRNYAASAASAEKALELAPGNADGLRLRYQAYRDLGDKEKAEQAFNDFKAAGEASQEAKRIYNEGVELDRAGNSEDAYGKFLQAAEMDPSLALANKAIMAAAYKTKRHAEAAAAAERLLLIEPASPEALRIRYDSYVALKDSEKTLEALVALGAVDKDFVRDTLLESAGTKFNAGDLKGAAPWFEKALEVDPSYGKGHYFLGLIEVNAGNNAAAKKHLLKFVELTPDDPDAASAKEMVQYLN